MKLLFGCGGFAAVLLKEVLLVEAGESVTVLLERRRLNGLSVCSEAIDPRRRSDERRGSALVSLGSLLREGILSVGRRRKGEGGAEAEAKAVERWTATAKQKLREVEESGQNQAGAGAE